MCHINAWFPIKPIKDKSLIEYWDYALKSSSVNGDGFGLWLSKQSYRWENKNIPNILAMHKTLKRQPYIITHQRLSTSGKIKSMIHPYIFRTRTKDENIVITGIHNGVLTLPISYDTKTKSDSYMFFEMLKSMYFDQDIDCIDALNTFTLKAIKSLMAQCGGSASILFSIKYREKEHFYYFRHNRELHCYFLDGGLYLSTSSRLPITRTEKTLLNDTLYKINQAEADMEPLGTIIEIKPKKKKQPQSVLEKYSMLSLAQVQKDYNLSKEDEKALRKIANTLIQEPLLWEPTTEMPWRYVEDWGAEMDRLIAEEVLKQNSGDFYDFMDSYSADKALQTAMKSRKPYYLSAVPFRDWE